jgi:hypothetical protein
MEALGTLEDPGDRFPEAQSRRQTIRTSSHAGKIEHSPVKRGPLWGLIAIVSPTQFPYLSGWGASTPAPPAKSTTPMSPSTSPTPPQPGTGVMDRELYLTRWSACRVAARERRRLELPGLQPGAGATTRPEPRGYRG